MCIPQLLVISSPLAHFLQYPSLQRHPPLLKLPPPLRSLNRSMSFHQVPPHLDRHKHAPQQMPERLRSELQPRGRGLIHALQRIEHVVEALHEIGRRVGVLAVLVQVQEELRVYQRFDDDAVGFVPCAVRAHEGVGCEFSTGVVIFHVDSRACREGESGYAFPLE
jgi:hypothetical protein